jgi:DNA-binding LacI/PurR family transcriptional regulator
MKDVASKAGVSLSTVSYVLSGSRPISERTKQLILKTMQELNFQPNAVARALASKRTRVLALLLSPQGRGMGLSELDFVRAATAAAKERDHHLVLLTEGMESEADLRYLKKQGLIDGVILMEVRLGDPRIALLSELGFPFALLGQPDSSVTAPWVDIDFAATFETIVLHLADLGHCRVGLINQGQPVFETGYGPVVRAQVAFLQSCGKHAVVPTAVFCPATPRAGW